MTFTLDVTKLYACVKRRGLSFYCALTWLVTEAVNSVPEFLLTIRGGAVTPLDRREPSFTDMKKDSECFHIVTMPAGCSEHQTGLGCDITDHYREIKNDEIDNTDTSKWLVEHCAEYGFIHRFPGEKFVFLVSIMADKDVDEMLELLLPLANRFVTVAAHTPRAMPAETLAEHIRVRGGTAEPAPSIEAGVARAVELGGTGPVCALGTLYFSGEVLEAFRKICPLSR